MSYSDTLPLLVAALVGCFSSLLLFRQSQPPATKQPILTGPVTKSYCDVSSLLSVTPTIKNVDSPNGAIQLFLIPELSLHVFVTTCIESAESLIRNLLNHPLQSDVIGFDVEMDTGNGRYPNVVALSFEHGIVLWRPGKTDGRTNDLPGIAKDILRDPKYKKVGASIQHDVKLIAQTFNVAVQNAVDLSTMVLTVAFETTPRKSTSVSLATLASSYTIYRKSENGDHSKWASDPLPAAQVIYSAFDAFLGVKIYSSLEGRIAGYRELNPSNSDKWTMRAEITSGFAAKTILKGADGADWKQWSPRGFEEPDVQRMQKDIRDKARQISALEVQVKQLTSAKV